MSENQKIILSGNEAKVLHLALGPEGNSNFTITTKNSDELHVNRVRQMAAPYSITIEIIIIKNRNKLKQHGGGK